MRLPSLPRHLPLAAAALLAAACGDSATDGAGESELISRVELRLTPTAGGAVQSAVIRDPDGNGPQAPLAQTGSLVLARGATYTGEVLLTNDLANPPVDITAEVDQEATEHQFFYTVAGFGGGVTVDNRNTDANGLPYGRTFRVTVATGASGTGTIRVVLSHYDGVTKTGSAPGNETDVDLTFSASTN